MRRAISRTLLASAVLGASLVLSAAPSYAQMAPEDAGISDADWQLVVEIGEYNNAYMSFVDNSGEATMVFTGGTAANDLQYPSDFTGFSDPNLLLYGEYSQFDTNDQIDAILEDTVTQISDAGYLASATYNPDTDVVDVSTDAPTSVTDPLVATYDSKISIIAADIEQQSGSGGTAHHTKSTHSKRPSGNHTKKRDAKTSGTVASPSSTGMRHVVLMGPGSR